MRFFEDGRLVEITVDAEDDKGQFSFTVAATEGQPGRVTILAPTEMASLTKAKARELTKALRYFTDPPAAPVRPPWAWRIRAGFLALGKALTVAWHEFRLSRDRYLTGPIA